MARTSVSGWLFALRRYGRRLWVRATLIALLALVAPFASRALDPFVPDGLADALSGSTVTRFLEIVASSMLAVTTFSLGVMLTARQAASQNVTPRSHQLILEDTTAQTVLATFIGAFVFSLISLIIVSTGFYAGRAVVVILAVSLFVTFLVIAAILRWIEHLQSFGSVPETSRRVEAAALAALRRRAAAPCLGGRPMSGDGAAMAQGRDVGARSTGYVVHVDAGRLDRAAEAGDGEIALLAGPGAFVVAGEALVRASGEIDEASVHAAITLADARGFDEDPHFGVVVLTEIAERALSPGINDPGTAIDIVGRLVRVLVETPEAPDPAEEPAYQRVCVAPLDPHTLVRDAFDPIARDGADVVEVHLAVQNALASLARRGHDGLKAAALRISERALRRSDEALAMEEDRERVRAVAPAIAHESPRRGVLRVGPF